MEMALLLNAPWIAAVVGAAVCGISNANFYHKMQGRIPQGWWKSTALYVAYAIFVCCLWVAFALCFGGFA